MEFNFLDRVVIVTGASKGIGYACAEAFVDAGARVILVSRSQSNLDTALARMPRGAQPAVAIVADLKRSADAERMVAEAESAVGRPSTCW